MILWSAKPAVKRLDSLLHKHVICDYIEGIKYLKCLHLIDIAPVLMSCIVKQNKLRTTQTTHSVLKHQHLLYEKRKCVCVCVCDLFNIAADKYVGHCASRAQVLSPPCGRNGEMHVVLHNYGIFDKYMTACPYESKLALIIKYP